jgi:hypothetical protein
VLSGSFSPKVEPPGQRRRVASAWQDSLVTSVPGKALASLLALAPAAALLAGSPAHAAASTLPTIGSVSASMTSFVLSSKGADCRDVTFHAVLTAPMPDEAEGYYGGVEVRLYAPGKTGANSYEGVGLAQTAGGSATYVGSLHVCGSYTAPGAGRAEFSGSAIPVAGGTTLRTNVVNVVMSVKRPSTVAFNASPEPVKKGKKITAAGTLKTDGGALAHASVKIYFRKSGTTTYARKATLKTNSKGVFRTTFTAGKSGTWKVVYAGSSTRQAVSRADAVKVK